MIIEWIAVDIIWRLFSSQNEDGSGFAVCITGFRCFLLVRLNRQRRRFQKMYDGHPLEMMHDGIFLTRSEQ